MTPKTLLNTPAMPSSQTDAAALLARIAELEVANKALQEELRICLQAAKDMVPTTRAIFRVGKDLLRIC